MKFIKTDFILRSSLKFPKSMMESCSSTGFPFVYQDTYKLQFNIPFFAKYSMRKSLNWEIHAQPEIIATPDRNCQG